MAEGTSELKPGLWRRYFNLPRNVIALSTVALLNDVSSEIVYPLLPAFLYLPGPHDLPPGAAVYQQTQRWRRAGVFEAVVHDLRVVLRLAEGRTGQPSAAILDSRTLQSTPESGPRAGDDGAKRKRGSKVHMAVDTLGHLLALQVTAANAPERAQVGQVTAQVQAVTGDAVELGARSLIETRVLR